MSEHTTLQASDGKALGAYVARPEGEPIAALVVIQEIFGVNAHIRSVADGYAMDGFLAVAPALFDRIEPNVELGYDGADAQKARSFIPRLDVDKALLDVAAAIDFCKTAGKKVGVIGYCFGGTMAAYEFPLLLATTEGASLNMQRRRPLRRSCCISALKMRTFPLRKLRRCGRLIRKLRSISMTPATASIAMRAPVTTLPPRKRRVHGR